MLRKKDIYQWVSEQINHTVPELDELDEQKINAEFTGYIFYKDNPKKYRYDCECSNCHQKFTIDYEENKAYEVKHNNFGAKCKICGKNGFYKNLRYVRTGKTLYEYRRVVLAKAVDYNQVYLIAVYAWKNYSANGLFSMPGYDINSIYYITPETQRHFRSNYWGMWEAKTPAEPYVKTIGYNYSYYKGYNLRDEELHNTFLKYSVRQIENFRDVYDRFMWQAYYINCVDWPFCKFLCYSARYPQIEILIKLGLGDIVCNLIQGRPMKRYINWSGKNPQEMFGLNKKQFAQLKEHFYSITDFVVYMNFLKVYPNLEYDVVARLSKAAGSNLLLSISEKIKKYKLNLFKVETYLTHQNQLQNENSKNNKVLEYNGQQWLDYIKFAEELKYDLSRSDVIYPKNLQDAHDKASDNARKLADKKAFEKYRPRYEKLQKMYEYSDGEYMIVVPQGVNDIVQEGKTLEHCVGGYAARHIDGVLTILFMRKCSNPNKRFATIEIHGSGKKSTLQQKQGKKNRYKFTEREEQFVNEWLSWVKQGSKRPKKKKTASAA